MRFKVTSRRSDGKIQVHIYDNETQQIITEMGIPVALANDPRTIHLRGVWKHYKTEPEYYQKNFDELRIQLGLNCNYHCKYCVENHFKKSNDGSIVLLPPKQATKNLVKIIKTSGIRPNKIAFWGGEPLIYWKYIVELAPQLKELFDCKEHPIPLSLCTNGSLLTLDKVKFMLENNISLTISHDGWSFGVYRNDKDPLDNPEVIEAIQYYYDNSNFKDNIVFNVVITPENCEILKLPEWFENKVKRPIKVHIESIVKNSMESETVVSPFNNKTKKILMENLFYAGIVSEEKTGITNLREITSKFIVSLVNKKPIDAFMYRCGVAFANQVAIDLQGNILRCHGTDPRINTIGHLSEIESVINNKNVYSIFERKNCTKCPFIALCGGGCPIIEQDDLDAYCTNLKLYYSAFFASAWKLLFDGTLLSIETLNEE